MCKRSMREIFFPRVCRIFFSEFSPPPPPAFIMYMYHITGLGLAARLVGYHDYLTYLLDLPNIKSHGRAYTI